MTQNGFPQLASKRFSIWDRLLSKYLVESAPADTPGMIPSITPVISPITDIDKILETTTLFVDVSAVTATGAEVVHTVPAGERHTLSHFRMRLTSGSFTFFRLDLVSPLQAQTLALAEFTSSIDEIYQPNTPFGIDADWRLEVRIDAFTTAGNLQVEILAEVAPAF